MDTLPPAHEPDWHRIFPDEDHRWRMGIRRGDYHRFLQTLDPTGQTHAERAHWLNQNPDRYAALLPEAIPALHETVRLAQAMGVVIDGTASLQDQLLTLGRMWEVDFTWMHPDATGIHRLVGGVVCFPSSWGLREKLGRTMAEVHAPVPGLNDRFASQIESHFTKMVPMEAWIRENPNFSRDNLLNHHPSLSLRKLDATITPADFWIRLEQQLLMKLPDSGSILFGIRVTNHPLSHFLTDPSLARRIAHHLDSMKADAAHYKGLIEARSLVIDWLLQAAKSPL